MKYLFLLALFIPCIYGDVSYNVIIKASGSGGEVHSTQTRESIQGARMVQVSDETRIIIDSSRETITELNLSEKTYKVTTFQDIDQDLEKAQDELYAAGGLQLQEQLKQFHWSFEIKESGKKKVIDEIPCKELIFLVTGKFPVTQKSQIILVMDSEFCISSAVKGFNEIKSFTDKFSYTNPIHSMSGMKKMLGDLSAGLEALETKLAEMGGISLSNSISVKIRLLSPGPDQSSPELPAMEIQTIQSDFSTAVVSPALFEIPADFRKIETKK